VSRVPSELRPQEGGIADILLGCRAADLVRPQQLPYRFVHTHHAILPPRHEVIVDALENFIRVFLLENLEFALLLHLERSRVGGSLPKNPPPQANTIKKSKTQSPPLPVSLRLEVGMSAGAADGFDSGVVGREFFQRLGVPHCGQQSRPAEKILSHFGHRTLFMVPPSYLGCRSHGMVAFSLQTVQNLSFRHHVPRNRELFQDSLKNPIAGTGNRWHGY